MQTVSTDEKVTCQCLVHARSLHNDKFQEQCNNMKLKWDIVTETFNSGFESHVLAFEGMLFPPFDADLQRSKDNIKDKFEDLFAESGHILMLENDPQNFTNWSEEGKVGCGMLAVWDYCRFEADPDKGLLP